MFTVLCSTLLIAVISAPIPGPATVGHASVAVHKQLSSPSKDLMVKGRPFTATYYVMNLGGAPAYAVTIKDEWPAESFDVIDGTAEAVFPVLDSRENVTFSITLKPQVEGTMQSGRATVTYKFKLSESADADPTEVVDAEDNEVEMSTYSTTPGRVEIYSGADYDRYIGVNEGVLWGITLLGSFAALAPWYMLYAGSKSVAPAGAAGIPKKSA